MSTLSFVFFLVNNMSIHKRYMGYRKGELYHYNKNHDPVDGKFTSGPGGSISAVAASRDPKFDDPDYYQDDEVWAKAEEVIYNKVIPKINGVVHDRDDPEMDDISAMELAYYFYSEYKNYVHDHPEEKGRVDDYVEYVKANATKVDPAFTVKEAQTDFSDHAINTDNALRKRLRTHAWNDVLDDMLWEATGKNSGSPDEMVRSGSVQKIIKESASRILKSAKIEDTKEARKIVEDWIAEDFKDEYPNYQRYRKEGVGKY